MKITIKLILLFLIPGFLLSNGMFFIQTMANLHNANNEISDIMQFVAEQCARYDNLMETDEVQTQIDLVEKTNELSRNLQYHTDEVMSGCLKEYVEEQHLAGAMILDENLKPVYQAQSDRTGYKFWKEVIESESVKNICQASKKVLVDGRDVDGIPYHYVAMARRDTGGIVFCYERGSSRSAGVDEIRMDNLLTGYKIDMNGTVAMIEGGRVISSNDANMQEKKIQDCPKIVMFNKKWKPGKLTSIKKDKKTYYGRHIKCNQYYVYVFFEAKEVFSGRRNIMAYVMSIYLFFWIILVVILQQSQRRKMEEQQKKEMEYQEKLFASMEEAKRANVAKTEFLRRMSHDIRTPINGILGLLEIGDHFPDDMEKQSECRKKIRGASGFLFNLVNDVLDMSKMESGEIIIEEVPFSLKNILDEIVELIEVQAIEQGLQFDAKCSADAEWNLIGSPVHLHQILVNIAGNAVKYSRKNGYLHLSCYQISADADTAIFRFVCEDNGVGMSKEFQEHMFEPFTQEEDSPRTKLRGTGLGLSIVKKLLEQMDGTIEVASERGKGSKFMVTIPFQIDRLAKEKETKENVQKDLRPLQDMCILLVEDNELNMEIAEFILEDKGASIIKAWNGKEAVDIFEASEPESIDVILMDIMMPVMDGLTATQTIRKLERKDAATVPILAMTANAFADDAKRSRQAGMNEHLSKPLDIGKVIEAIEKYRR